MLQIKSVHNRLENKEQTRKKKKNEHKWHVAGDTTFIRCKRETSMSLTGPRQYPLVLVWVEIRKGRMKIDWKLIFSRSLCDSTFLSNDSPQPKQP